MRFTKRFFLSATVLSLAACGQPIELEDDASRPDGAIALRDAERADSAMEGGATVEDAAMDASDGAAAAIEASVELDTGTSAPADVADTGVDAARPPLVCAAGTANCNGDERDGCETSLSTNSNCGACGTVCTSGPRSTPMCTAGGCRISCDPGFGDCDGDPRNGCEVDLNRSTEHCGRCVNRCGGGANANPVCAGGLCGLSCNAGFADCDVNLGNGCEADLNNSVSHCRACGNACSAPANAAPTCGGGVCDFRCNAGLNRCGAQCVRPDDPAFGCGTCTACALSANATSMACGASGCVPATCAAGYKLCGTQCVAINDPTFGCTSSSCSSCALATGAAAMMCLGGGCAVASCRAGYKLCGNQCVSTTLPQYGCGGTANCASCNVQNAAAICNGAGSCDYSTCNAGWRDLDGIRSNGCETQTPASIPGLRVWLSAREPGSLTMTDCTGWAIERCISRWNNLADVSNPALPSGQPPLAWRPNADGTAERVFINGIINLDASGNPTLSLFGPGQNRQFSLGLASIVNTPYTVYVVDDPGHFGQSYPLACRPGSVFDTNGAFHFGMSSGTQLRLGHYNNDLNLDGDTGGVRVLIGSQSSTGRTITRTNSTGTHWSSDSNTALVNRAVDCSIGRGLDDFNKYSGSMYEVLIFNRTLTIAEQNTVRTYIRRRYGL
jgi:hypothetical protein